MKPTLILMLKEPRAGRVKTRLGRDIGMGLVAALPGLQRGFIREAAGLNGDLPRLLQGKAI